MQTRNLLLVVFGIAGLFLAGFSLSSWLHLKSLTRNGEYFNPSHYEDIRLLGMGLHDEESSFTVDGSTFRNQLETRMVMALMLGMLSVGLSTFLYLRPQKSSRSDAFHFESQKRGHKGRRRHSRKHRHSRKSAY